MSKFFFKGIKKSIASALSLPSGALTDKKLEEIRNLRAKGIVSRLSYGNISLQAGKYLTAQDVEFERKKFGAKQ